MSASGDARQRIGAAAIDLIDAFSAGDLLAAVTPERLAAATGYSASTIRYQIGRVAKERARPPERSSWSFARDALFMVIVDELFAQLRTTTSRSVNGYLLALEQLASSADPHAFGEAVRRDMDAFSPGGDDVGAAGIAERARLLTVIACEASPALAQQVRIEHDRWVALYDPVYSAVLDISQRRMLPGTTQRELAEHVSAYLQGLSERRRFDPRLDAAHVARSVVAVVFAFTEPLSETPDDSDALDAMLRGFLGSRRHS